MVSDVGICYIQLNIAALFVRLSKEARLSAVRCAVAEILTLSCLCSLQDIKCKLANAVC